MMKLTHTLDDLDLLLEPPPGPTLTREEGLAVLERLHREDRPLPISDDQRYLDHAVRVLKDLVETLKREQPGPEEAIRQMAVAIQPPD